MTNYHISLGKGHKVWKLRREGDEADMLIEEKNITRAKVAVSIARTDPDVRDAAYAMAKADLAVRAAPHQTQERTDANRQYCEAESAYRALLDLHRPTKRRRRTRKPRPSTAAIVGTGWGRVTVEVVR